MTTKQLQPLLSELTAIKAEVKTHLHYIGECGKGRIRQRLQKRVQHLDKIKSTLNKIVSQDGTKTTS